MEKLLYPWTGTSSTCGRCRGPWGQNCIDGKRRCRKVRVWWDNSYPCAACGLTVTTTGPMPEAWDDPAWTKIQAEHAPDCAWAITRGYLVQESHRTIAAG